MKLYVVVYGSEGVFTAHPYVYRTREEANEVVEKFKATPNRTFMEHVVEVRLS